MHRRPLTAIALALLTTLALAACGTTGSSDEDAKDTTSTTATTATATTEETTTTTEATTTTEGDDEICAALQDVADIIVEVSTATDRFGTEWSTLQPELIDIYERGLDAYTTAADVAPVEVEDDLATIRDNVEENVTILEDATSIEDFSTNVSANAAAIEDEATRVNEFSKDTCGFPTVPDS